MKYLGIDTETTGLGEVEHTSVADIALCAEIYQRFLKL